MRLLFIHGIRQEAYNEQSLLKKWSDILLQHGFDASKLSAAQPQMAFYGDLLHQLSNQMHNGQPMSASVSELSGAELDELLFIQEGLQELADEKGFTQEQIYEAADRAEAELPEAVVAIPMSTVPGRIAVGILRLLDELLPACRDTALRVLKQAYAYLQKPGVRPAIDARVKPKLGTGELVIVAHSLGTVVAFHLLRQFAAEGVQLKVPLLITCGSPLAIEAVKRYVERPHRVPTNVGRWANFYDLGDPVTLGKALGDEFAPGIVDDGSINNRTDNAHSIEGYLNQQAIQTALGQAI